MAKPVVAKRIELAAVLGMVREELIRANDAAFASGRPVMVFDECEVEFAVAFEEDLKVGFKIYFVQLGGNQKKSESNTIRVKFKSLDGIGLVAQAGGLDKPAAPAVRQTKPAKE